MPLLYLKHTVQCTLHCTVHCALYIVSMGQSGRLTRLIPEKHSFQTNDQDFEFLWDENVKCRDCKNEFADIANIRKHYKKNNFKCYMCGNCLKEKESFNHICGLEHAFKRTPLEERSPNWTAHPTDKKLFQGL